MSYLDTLKDDELETLSEVVSDDYIIALRIGPDTVVKDAALKTDKILAGTPKMDHSTTIYVVFKGPETESFKSGGELTDNSFLVGTKKKPRIDTTGSVILAVKVPIGTHALETDDWIILPRGVELTLQPFEGGVIQSIISKISPVKL